MYVTIGDGGNREGLADKYIGTNTMNTTAKHRLANVNGRTPPSSDPSSGVRTGGASASPCCCGRADGEGSSRPPAEDRVRAVRAEDRVLGWSWM